MEENDCESSRTREAEIGSLSFLRQQDFEAYSWDSLELADALEGCFIGKLIGVQRLFAAIFIHSDNVEGLPEVLDGHPIRRIFVVGRLVFSWLFNAADILGGACVDF